MKKFEAVVIGGGSGGYAAASTLAKFGVQTALIESADKLGGLCILRGCMPSKALIESANLCRKMRRSAEFGIHSKGVEVDMSAIQQRKDRLIEEFQEYREDQLKTGGFELIRGVAKFSGENEIVVWDGEGESGISFEWAVVATGSVPLIPGIEGIEDGPYWTSDDALEADAIPEHLIVLGAGAVGCEMAHYFEGLGGRVSIVQRSGYLLSSMEESIGRELMAETKKRGLDVHAGASVEKVGYKDGQVRVTMSVSGEAKELVGDRLLVATGRRPDSAALDLERGRIDKDGDRILVDAEGLTSNGRVFAIGDVSAKLPIVHRAVLQGERAAFRIAKNLGREISGESTQEDANELYGVFTYPECARAGLNDQALKEMGSRVISATYKFSDHGKAGLLGEPYGFIKLYAEKDGGKILAAAAIGPLVVDLIHEIQVVIYAGMTARELLDTPHYHPTLAEIWTYPAEELSNQTTGKDG